MAQGLVGGIWKDCLVHNFDESTNLAGTSARTGAISDCPRSSPTVDALWGTAQTHGSFISTRDDLSRKVAVGRARDKTGGEENIGRRYFPNGQKSWPATDQDEDGITLVFGKRAPIVGCPETDKYARDDNEEAQGDEEG
ncbi:hypothetical protein D6D17_08349 [Aureobasidium pullulans]|nr:hypothetical protein D6D17_08349 [Aureobasidium pullulans]